MLIIIWAVIGIISGLCCMLLSGLRMGRGIQQYLEISLIGCLGGILGGILVQNINIFLGNIFGPLYTETGFFTDGVLTGLLLCLWGCTLYLRALRPSIRQRIDWRAYLIYPYPRPFYS